jgi:predicted nuclease of predicted toxin-antitoxin system
MSGLGIRLYTDEDVHVQLAVQLARRGYDVLSCRDAGNIDRGLSDAWQLRFAANEGRAILVHNISDFVELDRQWRNRGEEHVGIILVPAATALGELVRRTKLHLDTHTPAQQYNTILYLARI